MSQASTPPVADVPPAPQPRSRGRQTAWDMVRSMALVVGLVVAVVLVFARPQGDLRTPADVGASVEQARSLGLPVAVPAVPPAWRASVARAGADTAEGLPTWHVSYLDAAQEYAGVDVTRGATPTWLAGVLGDGAERDGSADVAGATWQRWRVAATRTTALVREVDGTTTVVGARGGDEALAALATAVLAAEASAPATAPSGSTTPSGSAGSAAPTG